MTESEMSAAYGEGRRARQSNKPWEACPYPPTGDMGKGAKRVGWMSGWIETDIGIRLAGAFSRLGIEWP